MKRAPFPSEICHQVPRYVVQPLQGGQGTRQESTHENNACSAHVHGELIYRVTRAESECSTKKEVPRGECYYRSSKEPRLPLDTRQEVGNYTWPCRQPRPHLLHSFRYLASAEGHGGFQLVLDDAQHSPNSILPSYCQREKHRPAQQNRCRP